MRWGGGGLAGALAPSMSGAGSASAPVRDGARAGDSLHPLRFSDQPAGRVFLASDQAPLPVEGAGARPAAGDPGIWRHQRLRGIPPNRFHLLEDAGTVVLGVDVAASASALIARLRDPVRGSTVSWRWRSDGFPRDATVGQRDRDDFAARVYLMFDLPEDRLSLADRVMLGGASLLQRERVPAATLVYLLHAGSADDRPVSSPFTDRVMMMVARPQASAQRWYQEARDWQRDFQTAFGSRYPGPVPAPAAVAVGADGDQTGAVFSARFGDLVFS